MSGPIFADRVKETTTTTGTGTITLAGAATGYQSFAVVGNGNTCYYCETDGTNWEVILGSYTVSGTTLSKTTILSSSNSGSAVTWGAGSKDVFLVVPAVAVSGSGVIQRVVTSGSQATVTFSSIPAYFEDLELTIVGRDTSTTSSDLNLWLAVNGDVTAADYSSTQRTYSNGTSLFASAPSPSTKGAVCGFLPGSSGDATAVGVTKVSIPAYGRNVFQKVALGLSMEMEGSVPSQFVAENSFIWKSTAAITSLTVAAGGTAFLDGCVVTLRGLG